MHRPVCITYDSTCDLTPQLLERFRIRTVPLTIQSGERVFPDDGGYTSADLYADYRSRGTLPKTAAVSPEEFKSFFAPILAEGYDIVHIDISAELSCTCQNAVLAALGANMLKLKPCLEMREGKLVVCKKYRGSMDKVYRQYIAERLAGKAVVADHAFITHSGEVPEETLSQLTALVRELAPFEEVFVTQAGCTVSSHCGPGTLGVLFLRKA